MAQAKTRASRSAAGSTRRKASSPSSRRSSAKRASTRSQRSASRPRRSLNTVSSPRSRSNGSGPRKSTQRSSSRQSKNGVTGTITDVGSSIGSAVGKAGDSVGGVAQRAKLPALVGTAAAAGLAGGVALSRKGAGLSPRRRNGVLKSVAHEVQQVGREIGKTGLRLGVGDVNMEVQKGRKENRDSPLEVLLNGLTSRRSKR